MATLIGPGAPVPTARKSSRVLKKERDAGSDDKSPSDIPPTPRVDDGMAAKIAKEPAEDKPARKPISKRSKKALVKKLKKSTPGMKKVSEADDNKPSPAKKEPSGDGAKVNKSKQQAADKGAKPLGRIEPKKLPPKRKTLTMSSVATPAADKGELLTPEVAPVEPHKPQFPPPRAAPKPVAAPAKAPLAKEPDDEPDLGKTLAPPDEQAPPAPRRAPRVAIEEARDEQASMTEDEDTSVMDENSIDAIPPPPMFEAARPAARRSSSRAPSPSRYPPIDAPPGSHRAPTSMAPSAHAYGSMAPPPSMGPYSMAPGSMAPGTMAPPGAVALPARWLTGVAVVIAVTAMASFVLGLVVASGGVQVSVGGNDKSSAAPPPTPQPAPTTPPPAAPPPAEPAAATPQPAKSEPSPPKTEPVHVATLPRSRGFLVVTTSQEGAGVYINGEHVGPAGEKLEVGCGVVFIRLGNTPPPLIKWYGRGRATNVACQGETKMHLDPIYEPEPGRRGKGGRWMPGGL